MYASKVLAALAVVGFATASSSATSTTASQCSQATATISSQADASSLASCPTFTGDIVVDPSIGTSLTLDGIQQIEGSLTVSNAVNLTTLSASDLNSISGTMMLNDLTVLSTLQFPVLKTIGTINFQTLPALQSLTFTDVVNTCSSITISDTQLSSLDGINLDTVGVFDINNNFFLKTISTQVANITDFLEISSNGANLVVEFPNLIWAGNLTFKNTSSVTMQSLATINNTLGFIENSFESVFAPNLTSVGGTLTFVANSALSNITMDSLTTVGSLEIANNSALITINGFENLKTVSGSLDVTGNYSDAEFPALNRVSGAFHMVSSSNFSCAPFNALDATKNNFLGTYTCTPTSNNVQSGTGSGGGSSTSSGSSSTTTKKSTAGQLDVPTTFGLVGGFLAMLL